MKNNWIVGLIMALILMVIAIIFALQNSEPTAISFLAWDYTLPLALIIIMSFVIGVLTTLLLTIPGTFRRKREISSLKKENKRLLDQIDKITEQPTSVPEESTSPKTEL